LAFGGFTIDAFTFDAFTTLFLAVFFFEAGAAFFFAVPDETCALTASFTRATAAFRSFSTSLK